MYETAIHVIMRKYRIYVNSAIGRVRSFAHPKRITGWWKVTDGEEGKIILEKRR